MTVFLLSSELAEELFKEPGTLVSQDSAGRLYVVIVRKIKDLAAGTYGAALGVGCAEIDVTDMRLDNRSRTHIAGLECDIEVAVEEVPGRQFPARLGDADHLCMKRRILFCLTEIVGACDDAAVFYNDTADRRLAESVSFLSFGKRGTHVFLVYFKALLAGRISQEETPLQSSESVRKKGC